MAGEINHYHEAVGMEMSKRAHTQIVGNYVPSPWDLYVKPLIGQSSMSKSNIYQGRCQWWTDICSVFTYRPTFTSTLDVASNFKQWRKNIVSLCLMNRSEEAKAEDGATMFDITRAFSLGWKMRFNSIFSSPNRTFEVFLHYLLCIEGIKVHQIKIARTIELREAQDNLAENSRARNEVPQTHLEDTDKDEPGQVELEILCCCPKCQWA